MNESEGWQNQVLGSYCRGLGGVLKKGVIGLLQRNWGLI